MFKKSFYLTSYKYYFLFPIKDSAFLSLIYLKTFFFNIVRSWNIFSPYMHNKFLVTIYWKVHLSINVHASVTYLVSGHSIFLWSICLNLLLLWVWLSCISRLVWRELTSLHFWIFVLMNKACFHLIEYCSVLLKSHIEKEQADFC